MTTVEVRRRLPVKFARTRAVGLRVDLSDFSLLAERPIGVLWDRCQHALRWKMPVVRGDSQANPVRGMPWGTASRRGRWLVILALAVATTSAGLSGVSVVAYLGRGDGLVVALIVSTFALGFATFNLLTRMGASGVLLGIVRRTAAGVGGGDLKKYLRAAKPTVKAWGSCVMALAVIAVIAAGPVRFLPAGDASVQNGAYVENDHGAVRVLTLAQYEQLNMRTLRFAATISTLMLGSLATMLSAAIETQRRNLGQPAS